MNMVNLPAQPFTDHHTQLPPSPKTVEETGLSKETISELLIKHLYKYGKMTAADITEKIKLPFYILDDLLEDLIFNKLIEKSGHGVSGADKRYTLLNSGYNYADNILKRDSYIGPAPVTLEQYSHYVELNKHDYAHIDVDVLKEAWSDLILEDEYFKQVGPAIYSGRSCYLYGPAGSGKTYLAKKIAQFLRDYFDDISLPYAIYVAGYLIQLYDPLYHTIENQQSKHLLKENFFDRRWIRSKRPIIICGGELTLRMLDLQYKENVHFYESPMQLKANGGVLILDDFGRQQVDPKHLLNRWIYPLEENKDFLSLHTGYKFPVPFDLYVIFATNIVLENMHDDAFMRRLPYKINLTNITKHSFLLIFEKECSNVNITFESDVLDKFVDIYYSRNEKPMMAYQPKEFVDKFYNYCRFNKLDLVITKELIHELFDVSL